LSGAAPGSRTDFVLHAEAVGGAAHQFRAAGKAQDALVEGRRVFAQHIARVAFGSTVMKIACTRPALSPKLRANA
jgi:hypothetical protein